MKLIYRGATYDYNPTKVADQPFQPVHRRSGSAYTLTYRGVTYDVAPNTKPTEVPVAPRTYRLNYRGVTYLLTRTAQGRVIMVTQPINPLNSVYSHVRYCYESVVKQVKRLGR